MRPTLIQFTKPDPKSYSTNSTQKRFESPTLLNSWIVEQNISILAVYFNSMKNQSQMYVVHVSSLGVVPASNSEPPATLPCWHITTANAWSRYKPGEMTPVYEGTFQQQLDQQTGVYYTSIIQ